MMLCEKAWIEKRRFQRVEAALSVTYSLVDQAQALSLKAGADYKDTRLEAVPDTYLRSPVMSAMTQDISEGGLSLVAGKALPIGCHVLVDIQLSRAGESLRALAMVMRSEEGKASDGTSASCRMGLKLIALQKQGLQRLQALIIKRAQDRPGQSLQRG
jgi:c-di-GMP-binding flagellar brake protein YcgR